MDQQVNTNLRKISFINAAIVLITISLRLSKIGSSDKLAAINACICSIALVFGLIYALSGCELPLN